jgi:hypothetical protein
MNIIKRKSGSTKFVSAIVIGSLLGGTLLDASSERDAHRSALIGVCYTDRLTPEWIRQRTPEEFGLMRWTDMYEWIFRNDALRNAVTSEQFAAIPEQFIDDTHIARLSSEQLKGATEMQLQELGRGSFSFLKLQEMKQLDSKLVDSRQKKALKIAVNRSERMREIFSLIKNGGDQKAMLALALQGINPDVEDGNCRSLFCAACCFGAFDFALYLLGYENLPGHICESDEVIALLCLETFKRRECLQMRDLDRVDCGFDYAKVNALEEMIYSSAYPDRLEQIKPLLESPELKDYYRMIIAWLLEDSDDRYPPALEEYFVSQC